MNELIDYLCNNTQLSRFSRGEVRAFLERLDNDGWQLIRKPQQDASVAVTGAAIETNAG